VATVSALAEPADAFAPTGRVERLATLRDSLAMTKPEVNLLVAITTAAAFALGTAAAHATFPWVRFFETLAGTVLVASGAAALNQWMERGFDARMRRTARRPVAAGRIDPTLALALGALLSLAGVAILMGAVGGLPSFLATATLLGYLFLYTPAKRRTPFCTLIGAIPGAVPPLIGWAAARGRLDFEAWVLYGILFIWQFPHFMAIAWLYRDDYDRAGYAVLPRGDGRGRFVALQTTLPLFALAFTSLLPGVIGRGGAVYAIGALALNLAFLARGVQFAFRRSAPAARALLSASIFYLPMLLGLRLLAGWIEA
jgi:protoheme IX farnesyltransferase